ncbi:MAG: CRTAC1 family protein [bacterium]|nr:CRTAC1 family protein [bacterium]
MSASGVVGAWARLRDTIDIATGTATDYLWPGIGNPPTWSDYLDSAGDLSELTVVPGAPDEVFVGEGRNDGTTKKYGLAGYFRYGLYANDGAQKKGWAHIHRTNYNGSGTAAAVTIYTADWRNGDIHEEALTGTDAGWLGYYPYLNALTPFAVHPVNPNIMAGIDYGIPMMTRTGDTNWSNLYCKPDATGLGWTTRGLNLMCSRSSALLNDGRLLLGAMDWGVFCSVNDDNDAFNILRSEGALPNWPHCWDLEVVAHDGHEEIFMVDDKSAPDRLWKWVDGVSSAWAEVSTTLMSGVSNDTLRNSTRITDTVFLDSNTVVAAVGRRTSTTMRGMHFYLYRGVRTGSGWDWTMELDAGPAVAVGENTKWINALAVVPGTTKLLFGAKYKSRTGGIESGGLFCVDYAAANWSSTLVSWFGDYTSTVIPSTARDRLGRNVTAIGLDRLGQYVYVGCSGHDQPAASARGGVVRLRLEAGHPVAGSETILAGDGPAGSDDGDKFGLADTDNYGPFSPVAQSLDWEYCTRINEIDVDPNNPLVAYVAVGYGNFQFSHDGLGAWRVDGTVTPHTWTPLWGANETGSGAKTVAISHDGTQLYVGSLAQEFFAVDLQLAGAPTVAEAAEYSLLANATSAVHALAVRLTPIAGTTITSAFANLGVWNGDAVVPLYDDGVDPDLELGDGIFTSRRTTAQFGAPGSFAVPVYVEASNHGYATANVTVTVTATPVVPTMGDQAVYRLRAGSSDASHVLAVSASTSASTTRVTADLSALSGPVELRLRDDGVGEDVKAGDGIFTSPRFAASMPDAGTYVASVTATPMVGGPVTQSVGMLAVTSVAKFKGDGEFGPTARLGDALALGLSAKPYASVYFWEDTNNDTSDKVMITTFDDNSTAPGIWGRSRQFDGSEGSFVSRSGVSEESWLLSDLPAGSRGVCYADVDNDGDTDFFLCNPSQGGKLYINHLNDTSGPAEWRGKFVDQTAAFFGADTSYLAGAMTASWGDYTGDGFVDLFVATGTYVDPVDDMGDLPMQTSGFNGGDLRLFKNNLGTSLRNSLVWGSGSSAVCLAGCWLDLDGDGDLDLVTTRYMGGGFSVLENHGVNATHTDNVMEQVAWTPSVADIAANSITVIDYDHNAQLDILVTECTPTRKQAWVLRNNYGSGYSKSFTATGFGAGQAWNGAVVADLNLDGQDDFVLLPKSADVVPALFMSTTYTPTPEFEDPWPAIQPNSVLGPTHYVDLGYTLGIRDGMTGGGFAADLDGDHAPDLFLGREMVGDQGQSSGEHCLYRSTGTAATTNHWLQVKLRTRGDSNGALIGTLVSVVAGGKQWHKAVDGGSFRGGQGSNDLLFGLGSETSITEVKVVFPSGETHLITEPYVDVDTPLTVWEENMDVLSYARPSSSYELQPGFVNWVFRWKTGTIKGDLRTDQVEIWPFGGDPNNKTTLSYSTPAVTNKVYKENGVWVHELVWGGLQCSDGMRWTFQVSSSAGTGGQVLSATQTASTASVTYCLPENYGQ